MLDYVTVRGLSDYRVNLRGLAVAVARALGRRGSNIDDSAFGRCEREFSASAGGLVSSSNCGSRPHCGRAQYRVLKGNEIHTWLLHQPEFEVPHDVGLSRPVADMAGSDLPPELAVQLDALCDYRCREASIMGVDPPGVNVTGLALPNVHKCAARAL